MKTAVAGQPKEAPPRAAFEESPPTAPSERDFLVVGIGASAGGLEACSKLMDALPAKTGMAFILVQHLDPSHKSMLVELLAGHTNMTVQQAADGMPVEPDHLYVIPPATYLSVGQGALRLTTPDARHGARLPFDFLLRSMALEYGARAVGVVLSGTGADGSLGVSAIANRAGYIIAQDIAEAGSDGMPQNAVLTGAVDVVLPVGKIPAALLERDRGRGAASPAEKAPPEDLLPAIVKLLGENTAHDFRVYKHGTLRRRIERRMALASIGLDHMDRYIELLRGDPDEIHALANDLLINVTKFFRDGDVFDCLAAKIIPELLGSHPPGQPVRVWIAGCSTGEEAYSVAMLFQEAIAASKRAIKLQIFASDVDPDAVASARAGLYAQSIEADVSDARLSRFFVKEDPSYRVSSELRGAVVFTVQDVLADPPFSRLDLISCRNLLIYLRPEAQKKVLDLFHFALRDRGVLLLGNSETIGDAGDLFETILKPERVYRQLGSGRVAHLDFPGVDDERDRDQSRRKRNPAGSSRDVDFQELCQRLVMDAFAPAAMLVNGKRECLFSLGPVDRYLRVAPGLATHDLLAMAPREQHGKLASAFKRASIEKEPILVQNCRQTRGEFDAFYSISVQRVAQKHLELYLVCFVDEPRRERKHGLPVTASETTRVAELEVELEAARLEVKEAHRTLEMLAEEQKAINEEASSVNEEFQSTNEELTTSKEELQSLNEELTALNGQLQETLERQRTTSNDLQNVLYSTNVATIFLDLDLKIRFFTPATKLLFNVIPSDVGRPLDDLSSLAADDGLIEDAKLVLTTFAPSEKEIQARSGAWYLRRIMPYRTQDNHVAGVVITFLDKTERRHISDKLIKAEQQARLANLAKSRFLAAASLDLRQPLQAISLVRSVLAKKIKEQKTDEALKLVGRLDEMGSAMAGMLNALLDINQIESGTVKTEVSTFPIDDLLNRIRDEFAYAARSQKLSLRIVTCGLVVESDPRLLEQIIRNLLSNALKYTKRGKVLLGCRRRNGAIHVEIWDTGIGIPPDELDAIFEEYHQIDNEARERSRGLGLGLFIVQRLARLLGHDVRVRSTPGKGSVFTIEIFATKRGAALPSSTVEIPVDARRLRADLVLVIEDDPEVRELLELHLREYGHGVVAVSDGVAALDLFERSRKVPDIVLADFNLPNGLNGILAATRLRSKFGTNVPTIVLTGDISTATLLEIERHECCHLDKPVRVEELDRVIQNLLSDSKGNVAGNSIHRVHDRQSTVFVVDDEDFVREAIRAVLEDGGLIVEDYASCQAFLDAYRPDREGCLLVDALLPDMGGLELLGKLKALGSRLPAIMITGNSDVPLAVEAMKSGVVDFIEKPVGRDELIASVERALELVRGSSKLVAWRKSAADQVNRLTERQREIMTMVLAGHPSKNIAADLKISQRTVENHRASIMRRTGSKSLPALARLALAAAWSSKVEAGDDEPKAAAPPPME